MKGLSRRSVIAITATAIGSPRPLLAQSAPEVAIGLSSSSFATAPARIVQGLGLFEKHGVNARISVMESGNVATTALISRSIQFNLTGSTEVAVANGRGQRMVAIANVYGSFSGSVVIARAAAEKSGVSIDAPAAARFKVLDGLLIASPSATSSYTFAVKRAAEMAGANVRFTYISQPAMAAALQSGAIQGYICSAPFWAQPVLNKVGVLWLSGPKGDFPIEVTPVSAMAVNAIRDYAEANPDVIRRVAAAFAEGTRAVSERPADVKAIIARLYPDLDAATLELLYASESLGWKTTPLTPADMAREVAFLKSTGVPLPQIDGVPPAAMLFP